MKREELNFREVRASILRKTGSHELQLCLDIPWYEDCERQALLETC